MPSGQECATDIEIKGVKGSGAGGSSGCVKQSYKTYAVSLGHVFCCGTVVYGTPARGNSSSRRRSQRRFVAAGMLTGNKEYLVRWNFDRNENSDEGFESHTVGAECEPRWYGMRVRVTV